MSDRAKQMELITTVKDAINKPYCFPGGYEKQIYLNGEMICRTCCLEHWADVVHDTLHDSDNHSGWAVMGVDVYWEGPPMHCCQCGKEMTSEYGDPDGEGE